MASNPFFSGRIPQALFDHIESFREKSLEKKTDLLIKALAQYTGFELEKDKPQNPPIRTELDNIYSRLQKLESLLNNSKETITVDNNKNQLELKYDNKKITNDNVEERSDNSLITKDNELEESNDIQQITTDNSYKLLLTKDVVKLTGTSQSALSLWKKENKFPKIYVNKKSKQKFEIDFDEERSAKRKQMWRVKLIDNK